MVSTKVLVQRLLAMVISKPGVDIFMRRNILKFLYDYGKELKSDESYSKQQVADILMEKAILSGYNFSTPIPTLGTGTATNISSPNTYVSDIETTMPNTTYLNRVIGISIQISGTTGTPNDNDTFYFCDGSGSSVGNSFTFKNIVEAQNNGGSMYFGWIYPLVDDVYYVDTETLDIIQNFQYYDSLDVRVDNIIDPGMPRIYNFDITYYLA